MGKSVQEYESEIYLEIAVFYKVELQVWFNKSSLGENYTIAIKEAFFAISNSETEKRETKQEADRICLKLRRLETASWQYSGIKF